MTKKSTWKRKIPRKTIKELVSREIGGYASSLLFVLVLVLYAKINVDNLLISFFAGYYIMYYIVLWK